MKSTMMTVPLSVNDILARAARLFPNSDIVSRLPDKSLRRLGYAEMSERARSLALGLRELGIRKGDRVATLCWNHHAHLECYFGIPLAGAVLHTLNLRLAPEDIAWIAADAGSETLIVDDVLLAQLERILGAGAAFERIIVVPFAGDPPRPGHPGQPAYLDYESLIGSFRGRTFVPDPHDENDPVAVCYTSGTTGRPKGVVYSHRSTVLHTLVSGLPDVLGVRGEDTVLAVTPMFHANCWGVPYVAVMAGARLVFPGPHLHASDLLDLIALERPTTAFGVPTVWLEVARALEEQPGRWTLPPGLRCMSGGAAMPEGLVDVMAARGAKIITAWGMTETSPVCTVNYQTPECRNAPEQATGSRRTHAGVLVPLVEIRIVGESGEVDWDGDSVGEIQVRGPFVTAEYHAAGANPDKHSADGWLRTGDVGCIDRLGYLRITDRSKDVIKSGGEWISSVALENALMTHPAIAEAAVIAVPHEKWQERPIACVVFKRGRTISQRELSAYLEQSFAKWQLPDRYEALTEIPRTSTGKFHKRKLRELFPR